MASRKTERPVDRRAVSHCDGEHPVYVTLHTFVLDQCLLGEHDSTVALPLTTPYDTADTEVIGNRTHRGVVVELSFVEVYYPAEVPAEHHFDESDLSVGVRLNDFDDYNVGVVETIADVRETLNRLGFVGYPVHWYDRRCCHCE